MEFSPFVGPDSLRQTTQLLKNLYDMHTKRYCGYVDINGSQYEGTAENWGSEMLFESRKMLMDKPALENIFVEDTCDYYFDIQYSGIIDNYRQQNMLCGVIKDNVLLSNSTYVIRFLNIEHVRIPRSESSSDPKVYVDEYIHTTSVPYLRITTQGGGTTSIPLKLTDKTYASTDYYFHLAEDTIGMYDPDNVPSSGTFDVTITDKMVGFPCIWFVCNLLRTLPLIAFSNNTFAGKSFLEIGTNGHDNSLVYPLFNNNEEDYDGKNYLLKVIPDDTEVFYPINTINDSTDMSKLKANYTVKIKKIQLLTYNGSIDLSVQPDSVVDIGYDDTYSKMMLENFDSRPTSAVRGRWFFRKPIPGDYDYDGTTYINPCYAYTDLKSFNNNLITDDNSQTIYVAAFKIAFNNAYPHPYRGLCENAYAGIHVDVTADYSNNGVSKKNGVIHNLGEFNGLPSYFRYNLDKTIHRAHTELYTIRDNDEVYKYDQKATRKQTAGIILDSGIPQNELQSPGDMPIVLYYDQDRLLDRVYTYRADDPNINKNNNMSEITFTDPYNFGNSRMLKHAAEQRFIYHGKRHFSLGVVGFNEDEIGRAYIISNDPAEYDNNALSTTPKDPRTFARICDIPTSFSQLINIKGLAPTLVIDEDYVRTEASYDTSDKYALWNQMLKSKVLKVNGDIIQPMKPSDQAIDHEMDLHYYKFYHLNDSLNLEDPNIATFTISSPGHGYDVGDIFLIYIGGYALRGRVKTTQGDGQVAEVEYQYYDNDGVIQYAPTPEYSLGWIARSNLTARITSYYAENLTNASSGTGLTIMLEINSTAWSSTAMSSNGHIDDVCCLIKDEAGNVWGWIYDNDDLTMKKDSQITGVTVHNNAYDDKTKLSDYNTRDVFLYSILKPVSTDCSRISDNSYSEPSFIPTAANVIDDIDYSSAINDLTINMQDSLFVVGEQYQDTNFRAIIKHERNHLYTSTEPYVATYPVQRPMVIPSYSDFGYMEYTNKSNKFHYDANEKVKQPDLFVYNPTASTIVDGDTITKDLIKYTGETPILLSDILSNDALMPEGIVDHSGILMRNVYISDEYTTEELDALRAELNVLSREDLIIRVRSDYPKANLLVYEGTKYEYSKERIIDYLISSMTTKNRNATYTDGDETLYRRPEVKLFRTRGSAIVTKAGEPIGEQPTGRYDNVSNVVFNPKVMINDRRYDYTNPVWFFRLDGFDVTRLDDYKVYDIDHNDISKYSILLIDGYFYKYLTEYGMNGWYRISTRENTREADLT